MVLFIKRLCEGRQGEAIGEIGMAGMFGREQPVDKDQPTRCEFKDVCTGGKVQTVGNRGKGKVALLNGF